jgi:MFS family permease
MRSGQIDRIYEAVFNEEDARVCTDISEDACRYVPRNFFLIVICQTLSNLGDHLANPKTVLTWLLGFVGAPNALVAFLVPIRESGSMVPQLLIASFVRRMPKRKMVWVAGSLLQGLSVLAIAGVAAVADGATAGWLILLLLAVFSLSRGLNSVASKDVLGKTIPKTRCGRVSGLGATISGLLAIVLGLFLGTRETASGSATFYVVLLCTAAALWFLAAFVYASIREFAGETQGGSNALRAAVSRLDLLRSDRDFRRFVIARALMLCSALSAPYYVVLAQQRHGMDLKSLGWFILANAVAASVSASFWGILADVSSRRVLLVASAWAAVLGLIVAAVGTFDSPLRDASWTYPLAFFLLGIAHSGVRLGRKTYVVDMAGGNRRTDYVAVSNTVIGVILLLTAVLAPLSIIITPAGVILVLSLCGLLGVATCAKLPEVQ